MKKIVISLSGGLGNQMFQYAMGRQLKEAGLDVQYDTFIFCRDKLRNYELDKFHTDINLVPVYMNWVYMCCYYAERKLKMKTLVTRVLGEHHEQQLFGVENDLIKYRYLDGYWQNTRYFNNIKEELRNEFVWKGTFNNKQKEIIREIECHESVMIHIRRGDYLKAVNSSIYVVQDESYYDRAVGFISASVKNPRWYVFSDDIEWSRSLSCFPEDAVFIDREISDSMYVDFELMKRCKHFIIANSTYSWWAAWLSENKDAVRIAPSSWYVDEQVNADCKKALLNNFVQL